MVYLGYLNPLSIELFLYAVGTLDLLVLAGVPPGYYLFLLERLQHAVSADKLVEGFEQRHLALLESEHVLAVVL